MAPAEPPRLTPCCTTPQDRGDTTQANARKAHSHLCVAGRNLENHIIQGFMFSHVGFHVFPLFVLRVDSNVATLAPETQVWTRSPPAYLSQNGYDAPWLLKITCGLGRLVFGAGMHHSLGAKPTDETHNPTNQLNIQPESSQKNGGRQQDIMTTTSCVVSDCLCLVQASAIR